MFKRFFLFPLWLLSCTAVVQAQCTTQVGPGDLPGTFNGVGVSYIESGNCSAAFSLPAYPPCSPAITCPSSFYIQSSGGPQKYIITLNFSKPVNNIQLIAARMNRDADTNFVVVNGNNIPTLSSTADDSCLHIFNSNQYISFIHLGGGVGGNHGGGLFTVNYPGGYTSITIYNPYTANVNFGQAYHLSICQSSIQDNCGGLGNELPVFNTPQSDTTIHITEGSSVSFPVSANIVPATDTVKLRYDISNFIPNSTVTIAGADSLPGSVAQNFTWQSHCGQARPNPYDLTIKALGPCPYLHNDRKVHIYVDAFKPNITGGGFSPQICANTTYTYTNTAVASSSCTWVATGGTPSMVVSNTAVIIWTTPGSGKLVCKATSVNGCLGQDSVGETINALPTAIASHNRTICYGDTVVLGSTAQPGMSYAWSSSPTGFVSNAAQPSVQPSVNVVYYFITVTNNATQCSASATVTITTRPAPPAAAGADKVVCAGDSVQIGLARVPSEHYQWQSMPPGFSSSIAQPKVAPTITTTYIVLATDTATTCNRLDTMVVTPQPRPSVSAFVLSNPICAGNVTTLMDTNHTYPVRWFALPDTSNSFTTSFQPAVNPTITTTYRVVAYGATCTNNADIVVTVNPIPTVQIVPTGKDSICKGQSIGLVALGGTGFRWRSTTSAGVFDSTHNNISVSPTIATTYMVTVTDTHGCSNTASLGIYVNPPLIPVINPQNNSVCINGDTTILYARHASGSSFRWYIQGNAAALATHSGTDSILHVHPLQSTSYVLAATDKHTQCTGYDTILVTVYPKPGKAHIIGDSSVCPGQQGVFYTLDSLHAGSSYQWVIHKGSIAGGQGAALLTVNWNNIVDSISPYVKVVETTIHGCPGDTLIFPVAIKFNIRPPLPTGDTSFCSKDSSGQVYTAYYENNFTYSWIVTGGIITGTSGPAGSKATVTWFPAAPLHTIQYRKQDNSCYGYSHDLYIYINPSPSATHVIGTQVFCAGDELQYSIAGMQNSLFLWHFGKHSQASIKSGDSTTAILVQWPNVTTTTQDTVFVLEITDKGCPGDTLKLPVTINIPHSPSKILGPQLLCVGTDPAHEPEATYTATVGDATSRYVWTVIGAQAVQSSKDSSITVQFNNTSSGNVVTISVYEINKDSCTGSPRTINVKFDYNTPDLQKVSTLYNDESTIQVNWQGGNDANGSPRTYRVYKRGLHSGLPFSDMGLQYSSSYTDKNVKTDSCAYEYCYKVLDLCGDTAISGRQNSILLSAAADETTNMVKLNWTPYNNWPGGVAQYTVYRKLDSDADFTVYANIPINGSATGDTSIAYQNGMDGFVHRYRIMAIQNNGKQSMVSWSNSATVSFNHLIDIPNVITPNGDAVNDKWVIKNIENYHNAEIEIFNRWGQIVYHSIGTYQNTWDGTNNGQQLPDGTYFYIIKLNESEIKSLGSFTGQVNIIR